MAASLREQIDMFDYWVEAKGLDRTLAEYAPDIAKDPAVAAAFVQIKNGERAIRARVSELNAETPDEDS